VLRRITRRATCDDGFTLIEQIVALMIAAVIFMSLTYALIGGLKQSAFAQQNQQAGDILNQAVEKSRALPYDSLAMVTTDLNTGDALAPGTCTCYNPTNDTKTGAGVEPLVTDVGGLVNPHVSTLTQNGRAFTIRRYITRPVDHIGADYKRLTVVVRWSTLGKVHTRTSSTIVAPTQRGLPLPDFKFTSTSGASVCKNPGDTLVKAFTLKNNGARDAWTLSASSPSVGAPSWSYYQDVNTNGLFDSGVDTGLPNDPTSGLPSTGLIEPTSSFAVVAVAAIPSSGSQAPPYTWTITFTATSVAQPTYAQTQALLVSVQAGVCSGAPTPTPTTPTPTPTPTSLAPPQPPSPCAAFPGAPTAAVSGSGTLYQYFFHNQSVNDTNTAALATMPISKAAPVSTTLWDYATDLLPATAGRYLNAPAGSGSGYIADWRYGMPAATTFKGTPTVTIYAMPATGLPTASPSFTVTINHLNSTGSTVLDTDSTTFTPPVGGWGCTTFRPFTVGFTFSGNTWSLAANDQLQVLVKVTNSVPVLLAYDTTSFQSGLQLPVKSGVG
jgi:prepilin-type N-terminal cleavage/methylation domain-containing protein